MIKLCWKKVFYGRVEQYYLDMKTFEVYRIDLSYFESKAKIRGTPFVFAMIGPTTTVLGNLVNNPPL
ncbi:MAG: hypothetical protein ACK5LL_07340 [Suipraeoptans sp.]